MGNLTSSRMLQILDQDCLTRAEDFFVTDLDSEAEVSDWRN
jgi:hypothetical protein